MASEIADRYAQALFELALEQNRVREWKDQVQAAAEADEQNPELAAFFYAAKITADEKKEAVRKIYGPGTDKDIVHFLELLIDKGRMPYLREILKEFIAKCNDKLGLAEAVVYSARPLQEADLEKIRQALSKKSGRQIELKNRINPKLIAGIKVVMGGNVTDVSMLHSINSMKASLLKGEHA